MCNALNCLCRVFLKYWSCEQFWTPGKSADALHWLLGEANRLEYRLDIGYTDRFIVVLSVVPGKYRWDTRWRSWLMHYARSWKATGSIGDGVIGIFHWLNPFGRTMALGSTSPLTEMSTKSISWGGGGGGKGGRCVGLTTLPPSCANCLDILGASNSWNPQGLSRPVMCLLCLFFSDFFFCALCRHYVCNLFCISVFCPTCFLHLVILIRLRIFDSQFKCMWTFLPWTSFELPQLRRLSIFHSHVKVSVNFQFMKWWDTFVVACTFVTNSAFSICEVVGRYLIDTCSTLLYSCNSPT
jgi:hypothetical protein